MNFLLFNIKERIKKVNELLFMSIWYSLIDLENYTKSKKNQYQWMII